MMDPGFTVPRAALLAALNGDKRVTLQLDAVIQAAMRANPAAINAAQTTADQGVGDAAVADGKAVAAQATADQGILDAAAAQADADALEVQEYVVTTAVDPLVTPNARLLIGDTGLTVDLTNPNEVALILNVIAALGYTPADLAGADFSGLVKLTGGVWLGVRTANADAPINGYITVMDSAGVSRKLATIA